MASLSEELERQVFQPIKMWVALTLESKLKDAALPGMTGALAEGVSVSIEGTKLRVHVTGPAHIYAYDWEFGKQVDPNAVFTHTYTRRSKSGQLLTVKRTYKNGMKPQKVPKKMAGGGNPWRVYPEMENPGTGKFRQAFEDTMSEFRLHAPRILPDIIQITSLD